MQPSHSGMQASIFGACPKPPKIGRVVPGRASAVKMVGMAEVKAPISMDLQQKIQKMSKKDTTISVSGHGPRKWGSQYLLGASMLLAPPGKC